ncbi:flagellar basal body rod protein FlgF [Shewanella sp. A32]|uniref:flagellar basal body rod protein FlgF n=1 Tax=Shewanella sp. A32 TaxID=3031327 RepID=UPI0023B92D70|nr:flagellar basal body rod protein FlgF [Shewanella sp. A32]MDF0535739.1 flagellar basal body rod protein FlgF [Shewanella sp. A32]
MERLIYTAVSGAELNNKALQVVANNLANVNTAGFRADLEQAQSMMIRGDGFRTRYQAQLTPVVTSLAQGPMMETGRKLDVALSKSGYLAVLDANGNEAYTRAGNLQVDGDGVLRVNGLQVLGDGGPIQLPQFGDIDISADGTINLTPVGGGLIAQEAQIKLVSANSNLVKGSDGLLRDNSGQPLNRDDAVTLVSGKLEGSNVNAVEQMVKTMNISRQFEMNVKMMKVAEQLASSGDRLIRGEA